MTVIDVVAAFTAVAAISVSGIKVAQDTIASLTRDEPPAIVQQASTATQVTR